MPATRTELADVLAHCGGVRAVAKFLDPRSLARLSSTEKPLNTEIKSLRAYRLEQAIGDTDLSADSIDFRRIMPLLNEGDRLYLNAMAIKTIDRNADIRGLIYDAIVATGGSVCAGHYVNYAAANGLLGFDHETGRAYLEERAARDKHAQEMLNEAASYERLGLGRAYLEERAALDIHAQKMLNEAAQVRRLGLGEAYLQSRSAEGDKDAQKRLTRNQVPSRADLDARIAAGDPQAQRFLNLAAGLRIRGFTRETGYAYRLKRAKLGDDDIIFGSPILEAIFELQKEYRNHTPITLNR